MAKCGITNISGGGGIGSDELSTTKDYVLSGKTYVGADTNDEIGAGTMPDKSSSTTDYSSIDDATGNMGSISSLTDLSPGGDSSLKIECLIPKGYHDGKSKAAIRLWGVNPANVRAGRPIGYTNNSLKGTFTSDANVVASNILSGRTAYANGSLLTGTMPNYGSTPTAIDAIRINNNRFEVAVASGYHGYSWANNGYEYMTYDQVANAIGLTAAKLKKGETVCGRTGTFEGWVPTATDYYLRGNNIKGITINAGQQVTFESGGIRTENTSGSTQPYKKPELRFPSVNLTPYNYLNVTLRYESKKWSYNGERNLCMEANVRKVGSYTSDSLGKAFSSGLPVNTEFTISVPISTLAYTAEIILDLGITFEYYYTGDSGNKWETLDKYAWTGWIYRLWFS